MKLDLNETERCEQAQATAAAEAREATNRRRLGTVVIGCSCLVLLVGKSAIPHRPNGLFSRHLLGNKDKECSPPCLNGGACDTKTGRCICPSGFSGSSCQTSDIVDMCANVFCLNGGACNPANGLCVCSPGYTGDLCQIDQRTCDPACIGNSFCTPTLVCQCNPEYMGIYPNCIRNYCANVPCQNGGMCVNGSNDYTCTCPPGYTGKNCQTLATEKVVFVTKQNWNGDLGGLAGADQKCQGAADSEGLSGTFKAWLSDGSQSAASRLSHSSHAYVLPNNGAKVADSWDDLVGEESLNARIDRNEEGGAESSRDVWTGTNKNGNKNGGFCDDWSSSVDAYEGMTGDNNHFDHEWTDNVEDDCNSAKHLYCFQQ